MVWHDISGLQNVSSLVSVTDYVSSSTNGIFFEMLMILIFSVILLALIRYGIESALITSGFLCFILSLYLTFLKYVNFAYTLFFAGVIIFTGLYMYMTKQ